MHEPLTESSPEPRVAAQAPLVRLVPEQITDVSCHVLMVADRAGSRHRAIAAALARTARAVEGGGGVRVGP
ncbi:hypothetical protein, partial [Curtobacterium sp. BRD11]|uniref:hypothetical protein n=1 Tax=Curtobacterium sp. BRD11 TaxID=2962581 RepID=UPI0028811362